MSNHRAGGRLRFLGGALGLAFAAVVLAGCCQATPQPVDVAEQVQREIGPADAIPVLVTLAADEGEALAAARTRVLSRLQSAMPPTAFAAVRVYEAMPVLALTAPPWIVSLLLTHPDVRSVEADRTFEAF